MQRPDSSFVFGIILLALLASCGLKRPLEVPGHDQYKYKTDEEKNTPTPPDDLNQSPEIMSPPPILEPSQTSVPSSAVSPVQPVTPVK
jgi:predicted small lipoprotein YifL